jgi:hypothetical protein
MATNKSKNRTIALALVGLIILLSLCAYQWYKIGQMNKELTHLKQEMFEVEKIQVQLETDYEGAVASLDEMRTSNDDLNTIIDGQQKDLREQKDKILKLIRSEKELGKARTEIANLKNQADGFVAEITKLKNENQSLYTSNVKLTQEKEILTSDLNLEKEKTSELTEAKTILVSENETLGEENEDMSLRLDVASAIKINFMKMTGYLQGDDGNMKEKSRAKRINVVRTCFVTETNVIAPAGDERFYVRIIDPIGETMAVEDLGSGIIENKMTGQKVRYTQSGTLDYKNEDATGCIDWRPNYSFIKGKYEVEIYNKGYMVGKGNFNLK